MTKPLVSVQMVSYNNGLFLEKAIDSVLTQTYDNIELIVVDNGSTDLTPNILDKYKSDRRIKILFKESNSGIAQARNLALEKSTGEYIAVLDSDDYWYDNEKLKKQAGFLESNPNYVLLGGGMIKVDADGKEIGRVLNPESDNEIRKKILFRNPFAHSTVIYRRSTAINIGGYNEDLKIGEDYDLWLRLGKCGQFANLGEYAACYRLHESNITKSKKLTALLNNLKIITNYRRDYPGYYSAFLKRQLKLMIGQLLWQI